MAAPWEPGGSGPTASLAEGSGESSGGSSSGPTGTGKLSKGTLGLKGRACFRRSAAVNEAGPSSAAPGQGSPHHGGLTWSTGAVGPHRTDSGLGAASPGAGPAPSPGMAVEPGAGRSYRGVEGPGMAPPPWQLHGSVSIKAEAGEEMNGRVGAPRGGFQGDMGGGPPQTWTGDMPGTSPYGAAEMDTGRTPWPAGSARARLGPPPTQSSHLIFSSSQQNPGPPPPPQHYGASPVGHAATPDSKPGAHSYLQPPSPVLSSPQSGQTPGLHAGPGALSLLPHPPPPGTPLGAMHGTGASTYPPPVKQEGDEAYLPILGPPDDRSGESAAGSSSPGTKDVTGGAAKRRDRPPVPGALASRHLPDDGHQWHKYGHKVLMDKSFSRAYYRCAQRAQGCLAKKTVDFPLKGLLELRITYDGSHNHSPSSAPFSASTVVVRHKGQPGGAQTMVRGPQVEAWQPAAAGGMGGGDWAGHEASGSPFGAVQEDRGEPMMLPPGPSSAVVSANCAPCVDGVPAMLHGQAVLPNRFQPEVSGQDAAASVGSRSFRSTGQLQHEPLRGGLPDGQDPAQAPIHGAQWHVPRHGGHIPAALSGPGKRPAEADLGMQHQTVLRARHGAGPGRPAPSDFHEMHHTSQGQHAPDGRYQVKEESFPNTGLLESGDNRGKPDAQGAKGDGKCGLDLSLRL